MYEETASSYFFQETWQRLRKNPSATFALWILLIISLFALFGPLFSSYSFSKIHLELKNQPPSAQFWFGTDELGRDLFTRVWWGARLSLFIGIAAALIDVVLGVLWASAAAYAGGKVEEFLMRLSDILYSIPYLLVVIVLTVIRGPGLITILIAMTCTGWINMARIVRSQMLQLKENDYILAARAIGASPIRIIFRHLIPNALGPIIATMTLTIPTAIFTEAFLSFLGLGIQAPTASWGVMVNDGLSAMRYYPWRLFFPAALITFTMLGFNLLGNALRDALDPRLRT
jgi:oligopeptide transport system permease protein